MIQELINVAKNENIELEVLKQLNKEIDVSMLNGTLEKFEKSNITNYRIKANYQGKTIIIETEDIDIDKIIKEIKINTKISDNNDLDNFCDNKIKNKIEKDTIVDYKKIISDFKKLEELKKKYSELNSLLIQFSHSYQTIEIINEQTSLVDSNDYNQLCFEISVKDRDIIQTSYFNIVEKEYNFNYIKTKLEEMIEDTINHINCVSCKTNKYNIILKNNCVGKILNRFSTMFFAEVIEKKQSILEKFFEKQVFSPKLTIVEDPTNKKLAGKRLFDNEGTTTYYKEIIKDGKFICKLYNNQTALKENKKSTGNSYGVRNMYIIPGSKDFKELEKELKDGIVITQIEGLHAGANLITGQISLQAEGYYIKDSRKVKDLNMIILSTNLMELFNNIKEIGNDLEFYSINCGAPSLLIENITISGKE